MESDIIQFLLLAVVIEALAVVLLYLTARGLPIIPEVWEAFWGAVDRMLPFLRNLFNADTQLARALKRKGIDPLLADMVAELAADKIAEIAKPHINAPAN